VIPFRQGEAELRPRQAEIPSVSDGRTSNAQPTRPRTTVMSRSPSRGAAGSSNPLFSRVWRELDGKARQLIWEMRAQAASGTWSPAMALMRRGQCCRPPAPAFPARALVGDDPHRRGSGGRLGLEFPATVFTPFFAAPGLAAAASAAKNCSCGGRKTLDKPSCAPDNPGNGLKAGALGEGPESPEESSVVTRFVTTPERSAR